MANLSEILRHIEQARANEQLRKARNAEHARTMSRLATLNACVELENDIREGR